MLASELSVLILSLSLQTAHPCLWDKTEGKVPLPKNRFPETKGQATDNLNCSAFLASNLPQPDIACFHELQSCPTNSELVTNDPYNYSLASIQKWLSDIPKLTVDHIQDDYDQLYFRNGSDQDFNHFTGPRCLLYSK